MGKRLYNYTIAKWKIEERSTIELDQDIPSTFDPFDPIPSFEDGKCNLSELLISENFISLKFNFMGVSYTLGYTLKIEHIETSKYVAIGDWETDKEIIKYQSIIPFTDGSIMKVVDILPTVSPYRNDIIIVGGEHIQQNSNAVTVFHNLQDEYIKYFERQEHLTKQHTESQLSYSKLNRLFPETHSKYNRSTESKQTLISLIKAYFGKGN